MTKDEAQHDSQEIPNFQGFFEPCDFIKDFYDKSSVFPLLSFPFIQFEDFEGSNFLTWETKVPNRTVVLKSAMM